MEGISKEDKIPRVRIRVWRPDAAKDRIGHASLQTFFGGPEKCGIYASAQPKQGDDNRNKTWAGGELKLGATAKNEIRSFIDRDIILERGNPEIVVDLYDPNINVEAINQAYIEIERHLYQYSLWASTFFKKTNTTNCSIFCYHLLHKGGIKTMPYPLGNLFANTYIISEFIKLIKCSNIWTLLSPSYILDKLFPGIENSFGPRAIAIIPDLILFIFSLNVRHRPRLFALFFLAFCGYLARDGDGKFSFTTTAWLAALGTFLHYLLYTKTITPLDIATMAYHQKEIENGTYKENSFQEIKEHGIIKREHVKAFFCLANGIAWANTNYTNEKGIIQLGSVFRIVIGIYIVLRTWPAFSDSRISLTALCSALPFFHTRFMGSRGLIGTTIEIVNHLIGRENYYRKLSFALIVGGIFYAADKLSEWIDQKFENNPLSFPQSIQNQNLRTRTNTVITLPNMIKSVSYTAAYTASLAIGFFTVKRMVALEQDTLKHLKKISSNSLPSFKY